MAALNLEWGTDFTSWDAVQPMLTDSALARIDGNYAAWNDFKAWMDTAFARAVRAGTDALHRADPDALSGLEGGQLPGWGGYDYFQLAPAVDVLEIYDEANNVAIARAANPDATLLRTSFGPGDGAEAWRNLLQGGRGTVVWDEGDQVVRPDGSPAPRGAELARLVTCHSRRRAGRHGQPARPRQGGRAGVASQFPSAMAARPPQPARPGPTAMPGANTRTMHGARAAGRRCSASPP